jgi:hypothetical protein
MTTCKRNFLAAAGVAVVIAFAAPPASMQTPAPSKSVISGPVG